MRILDSQNVFVYGAGFYSFFKNWDQTCVGTNSCQTNMVDVDKCSADVYLYTLATLGSVNMISTDGAPQVTGSANANTYCDTIAVFEAA